MRMSLKTQFVWATRRVDVHSFTTASQAIPEPWIHAAIDFVAPSGTTDQLGWEKMAVRPFEL